MAKKKVTNSRSRYSTEDRCPICGSIVELSEADINSNEVLYDADCMNCGFNGTASYTMTFSGVCDKNTGTDYPVKPRKRR